MFGRMSNQHSMTCLISPSKRNARYFIVITGYCYDRLYDDVRNSIRNSMHIHSF